MKRWKKWWHELWTGAPVDWDKYEADLVKKGWSPEHASADRLEEEFSQPISQRRPR